MRVMKHRKGQFIVIAVLMIAIMIVSLGGVLYGAVTYYKRERWEEYLGIIDHVKIGCCRLVEISLADYTLTNNTNILEDNIIQWQSDLKKVYPGYGIILNCNLTEGLYPVYGENIQFINGTACHWYSNSSFSAADVTFMMNITSGGLSGYEFTASAFLRMKILNVTWDDGEDELVVRLSVDKEELVPITILQKDSFSLTLDGQEFTDFTVTRYYHEIYYFIYEIRCDTPASNVTVALIDHRNIKVIATEFL